MRKIFVLLLAVTLLGTTLFGCSPQNHPVETAVDGFTDFLDRENFSHSRSQISFREQVEQYTYKGEQLKDLVDVVMFDTLTGGGCRASGEHFGYTNNYERKLFSRKVSYTNSFYTKIALDNLTLPYGIEFDDTIAQAFDKMGITMDLEKDFVADNERKDAEAMTLYKGDGCSLTLRDHYMANPLDDVAYHYTLIYEETYKAAKSDGRKTNVTRKIMLNFGTDEALARVYVEVNENYRK